MTISFLMPSLKAVEQNIILRGQLATHLPDYMKALITYNYKTTWDDLLTALDAAHPYVNKMESAQYKSESVDVNTLNTSIFYISIKFLISPSQKYHLHEISNKIKSIINYIMKKKKILNFLIIKIQLR